ncbi:chorismate-binding protein [Flavobacteriaceae bacterium Ap0902]|nr:chorismate-binding protein [Flavobacteriaceae bacterium Ap0902]
MSQFLESIKLFQGEVFHLDWHQKRVDETFAAKFRGAQSLNLKTILENQSLPKEDLFKIRIVYDAQAYLIEVLPYQKRNIKTVEFIETKADYSYKSTNRSFIYKARTKSKADEVIFIKNGYIADSSYANLVFYDGQVWFTPTTYLLNGTTRQRLISEDKIKAIPILLEDITKFEYIGFINALNDLGEQAIPLNGL